MKRFLIALLAALPLLNGCNAFGKYPSTYEASEACRKFQRNRKDGYYADCKIDRNSRQIMYIKNSACLRNRMDRWGNKRKCGAKKIIKRFRY